MNPSRSRLIMHLDMDAFFASIEQRDNPSLHGKPVVVGAKPGGRGVVATCSYEARRYGIRSAMPIGEAYRRCPHAVYLTPDMARYVTASRAVMEVLGGLSPLVEPVSIDEAFVDVSGLEKLLGPPEQIAHTAKQRIFAATGLTASVGIGPNRLVAKLASEFRKPNGTTVVDAAQVEAFLAPMPVGNLRGIGAKSAARLQRLGLRTIAQLRACPWDLLAAHLGAGTADALRRQAHGQGSDAVGIHGPRKSLSRETTFLEDVRDWDLLREILRELAADVGRRTRAEGLSGRLVTLKIRFAGFETHTRRRALARPTHHDKTIFQAAWELTREQGFQQRPVRLVGIGLSNWEDAAGVQFDLFDEDVGERDKDEKLYATLDRIQARWGQAGLRVGMRRKPPGG